MNNFPVEYSGKTYWIARNMAVSCFVFTIINGAWHVLANRRGKNTPDYQGYWNCPCGYLDYNETTAEAAMREVYEETGVQLHSVKFWNFNDAITENLQNVTFRYYAIISDPQILALDRNSKDRGGECGEVETIAWIPVQDLWEYQWAFNHDDLINELVEYLNLN